MLLTRYLLDAIHCCDSAHAYTSVFIHNMHNHSVTTQTLISGPSYQHRGTSKTQALTGNLPKDLTDYFRPPPPPHPFPIRNHEFHTG